MKNIGRTVGIILKFIIVFGLIGVLMAMILIQKEHSKPALKFSSPTRPDFSNTLDSSKTAVIPTDKNALIDFAVYLYDKANENTKNVPFCVFMVDCKTDMTIDIKLGKIEMPVMGSRYIMKRNTEYFYTEYSIPVGETKALAGWFAKENTMFATRSYTDVSCMDYLYSEKCYEPKFITNDETGETEILRNWEKSNMVSESKWPTENKAPVFCSEQSGNYAQTDQVINKNTIKNATVEFIESDEGNYYRLIIALDTNNPETTSISIENLRKGADDENAAYYDMVETIEIWDNGYFKKFRSIDKWTAKNGLISSVIDYDTYFYYDEEFAVTENYYDFDDVKKTALEYNTNK